MILRMISLTLLLFLVGCTNQGILQGKQTNHVYIPAGIRYDVTLDIPVNVPAEEYDEYTLIIRTKDNKLHYINTTKEVYDKMHIGYTTTFSPLSESMKI